MVQRLRIGRILGVGVITAVILSSSFYSLGQTMAQRRGPVIIKTLAGMDGWSHWGQAPRYFTRNRVPHMTTYLAGGDRDQFIAYRSFIPGADSELFFTVHGGRGKVYLVLETQTPSTVEDLSLFEKRLESGDFGRVLKSVAGPKTNEFDVLIRWHLEHYNGQRLGVYVVDARQDSWAFISVSEFSFKNCDLSKP
ncbi:MAG: hypothetical protein P1V97_19335 [Planctomycetota bacterium]|nr:hypothetical protein [Planctomycetota bacterium]